MVQGGKLGTAGLGGGGSPGSRVTPPTVDFTKKSYRDGSNGKRPADTGLPGAEDPRGRLSKIKIPWPLLGEGPGRLNFSQAPQVTLSTRKGPGPGRGSDRASERGRSLAWDQGGRGVLCPRRPGAGDPGFGADLHLRRGARRGGATRGHLRAPPYNGRPSLFLGGRELSIGKAKLLS